MSLILCAADVCNAACASVAVGEAGDVGFSLSVASASSAVRSLSFSSSHFLHPILFIQYPFIPVTLNRIHRSRKDVERRCRRGIRLYGFDVYYVFVLIEAGCVEIERPFIVD